MRRVHLVHARIEQSCDLQSGRIRGCPETGVFRHGQEGVHRQHGHTGAKGQALHHGAGGAQTCERAGPATEANGIQLAQAHTRVGQHLEDRRNQIRRGLGATGAVVLHHTRAFRSIGTQRDREKFGSGIQGQKVHP